MNGILTTKAVQALSEVVGDNAYRHDQQIYVSIKRGDLEIQIGIPPDERVIVNNDKEEGELETLSGKIIDFLLDNNIDNTDTTWPVMLIRSVTKIVMLLILGVIVFVVIGGKINLHWIG
jgi:hypothetical protein